MNVANFHLHGTGPVAQWHDQIFSGDNPPFSPPQAKWSTRLQSVLLHAWSCLPLVSTRIEKHGSVKPHGIANIDVNARIVPKCETAKEHFTTCREIIE